MQSIVLFGDSLLGRFGKEYISLLEEKLDGFRVFNCAAGGMNSADGVERVDFISQLKPDVVVLSFGANDCAPWNEGVGLDDFLSNMQLMIESFAYSNVVVFLCPPVYDPDDLQSSDAFNDVLRRYNSKLRKLALDMNVSVIDSGEIYGSLLKQGNDYHMGDGVHLNEFGYDVFIGELTDAVIEADLR